MRFAAILSIVALGVGFLSGLMSAGPDMRASINEYYRDTSLFDFRLISSLGLTLEDCDRFSSVPGVSGMLPTVSSHAVYLNASGDGIVCDLNGISYEAFEDSSALNRFRLAEGRYPICAGECIAVRCGSAGNLPAVGDILTYSRENPETSTVKSETLTVVGIAESSVYFSLESESSSLGGGKVQTVLFAGTDNFDTDLITSLYITVEGAAAYSTFSDEYFSFLEPMRKTLSSLGKELSTARREELLREIDSQFSEAEAEAEEKLASARTELEQSGAELARAETALSNGKADLDAQKDSVEELRQALRSGDLPEGSFSEYYGEYQQILTAAKDSCARAQKNLDDLKTRRDEAPEENRKEFDALIEDSDAILRLLNLRLRQAERAVGELKMLTDAGFDSVSDVQAAVDRYDKGIVEYEEQALLFQEQQAAYEQACSEFEAAAQEGKAELVRKRAEAEEKCPKAEFYVLDRNSNISYVSFESNVEKVEVIAKVFPIFFFLIALLVTLTTMTRMIDEERMQIGTLKALGYSNRAIAAKYLIYAGTASVLGSAVGLAVGLWLFPTVVWKAYGIMYYFPDLVYGFHPAYSLSSALILTVSTVGASYGVCRSSLKECSAALMRPKAPKSGKRIFLERIRPLWNRVSFSWKVTFRNLFLYKKRLYMTVIGIMGCTALLLTGFGLRNSISDIIGLQFGQIWKYNLTVTCGENPDREAKEELSALLTEEYGVKDFLPVSQQTVYASSPDGEEVYCIVVSDPTRIADFVSLHSRNGQEEFSLDDTSVILSEKLCEQKGLKVGDRIALYSGGRRGVFEIGGICENYVYHYAYLSSALYEEVFGEVPPEQTILAVVDEDPARQESLSERLLKCGAVEGVSFSDWIQQSFSNMIQSIDAVVVILILCAAALAFIVLYNLTNINIEERRREIATIKVLGFYNPEVYSYIFREITLLTGIGLVFGLIGGVFLHRLVIYTIEVDFVMFGRSISFSSYFFAALLTLIFSGLVDLVMARKLRKISMVDSLKSPE